MSDKSASRILLVALGAIVSVKDIVRQVGDGVSAAINSLVAKGEANKSAADELLNDLKKQGRGLMGALLADAKATFNEEVRELAKKIAEKTESPPKPKESG